MSILLILFLLADSSPSSDRWDPEPSPASVVRHGKSRITLLTPRLVRLEWTADTLFEDRASLAVVHRSLPVPPHRVALAGRTLTIETAALTITHEDDGSRFSAANTKVVFRTGGMEGTWFPGMVDTANLLGTARTLDGADGDFIARDSSQIRLEDGLLSRSGWTLIDDSNRPLFDASPLRWVVGRPSGDRQDLYLLAYGRDYRAALGDFIRICGPIPLPPRFTFGYWYSRWRSSSESELRDLTATFRSLDIPLDVLLLDMDWHITARPEFFQGGVRRKDQAGQDYGWTGYSWNRDLFPEPETFLAWLGRRGIRVGLNLHPASGIHPHEDQYPDVARAMGIDTASRTFVPFDIVDPLFARTYFASVIHPLERQGVDFWWLDWQQWNTTSIPGVNPTFYLNHLHFTDMAREGRARPLIYHRWGGLGNHRYQIGFSGDTKISWASLAYQPYFTVTAANVGFGYWGNDCGGFYGPPNTPEHFTRWFQFGVFSPVLKTHATGRDFAILRKLWEYPSGTFLHLRELVHLRYALLPYLYTAAFDAHRTGISPCHPLYYDHPERNEAYAFRNEYYFGPDILVHPITHPLGSDSVFTVQTTWLPPGQWFEWHTGALLAGDTTITRPFRITDIPLYVRAGAVIPMAPHMSSTATCRVDSLLLVVYPGADGSVTVYDDDGTTDGYLEGERATTSVRVHQEPGRTVLTIDPVVGTYPGMPGHRSYTLRFLRGLPPSSVRMDGRWLPYGVEGTPGTWHYDGVHLTTVVPLPPHDVRHRMTVVLEKPEYPSSLLDGVPFRISVLDGFTRFLSDRRNFRRQDRWNDAVHPSDRIVRLAQTGLRISHAPATAARELRVFGAEWPEVLNAISRVAASYPEFGPQEALLRSLPVEAP